MRSATLREWGISISSTIKVADTSIIERSARDMIKWLLIVTNIDGSVSRNIVIHCPKKTMRLCVKSYLRSWEKVEVYKLKEVRAK